MPWEQSFFDLILIAEHMELQIYSLLRTCQLPVIYPEILRSTLGILE